MKTEFLSKTEIENRITFFFTFNRVNTENETAKVGIERDPRTKERSFLKIWKQAWTEFLLGNVYHMFMIWTDFACLGSQKA